MVFTPSRFNFLYCHQTNKPWHEPSSTCRSDSEHNSQTFPPRKSHLSEKPHHLHLYMIYVQNKLTLIYDGVMKGGTSSCLMDEGNLNDSIQVSSFQFIYVAPIHNLIHFKAVYGSQNICNYTENLTNLIWPSAVQAAAHRRLTVQFPLWNITRASQYLFRNKLQYCEFTGINCGIKSPCTYCFSCYRILASQ